GNCSHNNYQLIGRGLQLNSRCEIIRIQQEKKVKHQSLELCLNSACNRRSNLVIYKYYYKQGYYSCSMYKCATNADGSDWDYRWEKGLEQHPTSVYALPHHSIPRCHNSYFIRRPWDRNRKSYANCYNSIYLMVDDIETCMKNACDKKANVLDYFIDNRTCRIMNCNWKWKTWENFYFSEILRLRFSDTMVTYTLSSQVTRWESTITTTTLHYDKTGSPTIQEISTRNIENVLETGNETFTSFTDLKEQIESQDPFFKRLTMILIGMVAIFLGLSTVAVAYIITQRCRKRGQPISRNVSTNSSDHSFRGFPIRSSAISTVRNSWISSYISGYAYIDESMMLQRIPYLYQNDDAALSRHETGGIFRQNGRIVPVENNDMHEAIPLRELQHQNNEPQRQL
ncbi:unnamed protein product, partial [Owenia fusiformis]